MAERGTRTRIIFGGISAEVSLLKSSGKPSEAKHETRRVLVEQAEDPAALNTRQAVVDPLGGQAAPAVRQDESGQATPVGVATQDSRTEMVEDPDTGAPMPTEIVNVAIGSPIAAGEPVSIDSSGAAVPGPADTPSEPWAEPEPRTETWDATRDLADEVGGRFAGGQVYVPPETEVQQGVYVERDGERLWVNLTQQLADIDERTQLDGMEVMGTIPSMAVPRLRVRDARYVASTNAQGRKVLRLIFEALKAEHAAAVVRWTPKSAQALGILTATGSGENQALVVLDVEFAENMRPPSDRVTGSLKANVSDAEQQAAIKLVRGWSMPSSALDEIRDERQGKRAELLAAAHDGTLDEFVPPPPKPEAEGAGDLVATLEAAAAR